MTEREQEAVHQLEQKIEWYEGEIQDGRADENEDEFNLEYASSIVGDVIHNGREEPDGLPGAEKHWNWVVSLGEDLRWTWSEEAFFTTACVEIKGNTIYVKCVEDAVESSHSKTYAMETSDDIVDFIEQMSKFFFATV